MTGRKTNMGTVLLVEDEEIVLILAESTLQEHGFKTNTAADIASAMALLAADEPFDCLFTDINLDGDGLELAERFCAKYPAAAVLYTTGGV
jgi:CheY-like chemotaxis protein